MGRFEVSCKSRVFFCIQSRCEINSRDRNREDDSISDNVRSENR